METLVSQPETPQTPLLLMPVRNSTNELPRGPCAGRGSQKLRTPFEDDRDGGDRVFLEALNDLRSLVAIDAMDGTTLDHL